jgi:hypothetical protein
MFQRRSHLVPRLAAAAAAVRDPIGAGALGKWERVARFEDDQPERDVLAGVSYARHRLLGVHGNSPLSGSFTIEPSVLFRNTPAVARRD